MDSDKLMQHLLLTVNLSKQTILTTGKMEVNETQRSTCLCLLTVGLKVHAITTWFCFLLFKVFM